jgi:chromosome segregation ATPase
LNALYRRIGAEAASVNGAADDTTAARRQIFDDYIHAEDQETVDSAARVSAAIQRAETEIEKLRASLAIDDEKVKIEKYRKMIQDRKNKIAQAEKNIAEFEAAIQDSEASIEKLRDLL